jgi:hypothetical protein
MIKTFTAIGFVLIMAAVSFGQSNEPEFIGEACVLQTENSCSALGKEFGDFTSGVSWSHNSNKAFWLRIKGGRAKSRFAAKSPLHLVVRAVDNNSDPMAIVTIYQFKAKDKSRSVYLARDNSGTFLKSETNSKASLPFSGKKYGQSSYLITLNDLPAGEYGIVVSNPNNRDEKRVVVSCFGID